MLLIVVIVGVVVCVFLGHFAFSYHKQEKTVRLKGTERSVYKALCLNIG